MKTALHAARYYGPYWLYISANMATKFDEDYKAATQGTIRQRIMSVDQISGIYVVDQLTADNVVMVQATQDVSAMITGIPLQTVQWDVKGGFIINFKAFQILVPLVRASAANRSGVYHMS